MTDYDSWIGSLSPIILTLVTALFTLFTLQLNSCIMESLWPWFLWKKRTSTSFWIAHQRSLSMKSWNRCYFHSSKGTCEQPWSGHLVLCRHQRGAHSIREEWETSELLSLGLNCQQWTEVDTVAILCIQRDSNVRTHWVRYHNLSWRGNEAFRPFWTLSLGGG